MSLSHSNIQHPDQAASTGRWRHSCVAPLPTVDGRSLGLFLFVLCLSLVTTLRAQPLELQQGDTVIAAAPAPDPYLAREKGIRAMGEEIYAAAARFFLEYRGATHQREPDFADATVHLVKAYLRMGDVEAAAKALHYHRTHSRDLVDAYYVDAVGYWDAAVLLASRQWADAVATARPLTAPNRTGEFRNLALQVMGDALVAQGQWQEAEAILAQQLREFPDAATARRAKLGLVKVYLATNQTDKAGALLADLPADAGNEEQLLTARYNVLLHLVNDKLDEALGAYQAIASQRPREPDAEWWTTASQLAAALVRAGRYEDALLVLPHATALAPSAHERADTMLRTAEAQIALGKPSLAIDTLETFRTTYPQRTESVPVILKLAELLRQTGNHLSAAAYFEQVMEQEGAPPGFRYRAAISRGWCFRDAGQAGDAVGAFSAGEALGSTSTHRAQALFLAADTAGQIGNYGDAVTYYGRVADTYPDTDFAEESRFRQARALAELKDHTGAARSYARFLEQFPDSDLVQSAELERGIALRHAAASPAEFGAALTALRSFADTYPQSPQAPRALMEAFEAAMGGGDLPRGVDLLSDLLNRYPDSDLSPYALYHRARVRFYQASYDDAVQDSERFLEKYAQLPLSADILMYLGDYYNNTGAMERAKETYLRLVNSNGGSPLVPAALYEAARAAYQLEQLGSAGVLLDNLLAMTAPTPPALVLARGVFLYGDVLARQGKYREALEHFANAEKLAGNERLGLAARGRRGDMLYSLATENPENLQQAMACFTALLEDPAVPPDLLELAKYRLAKCQEMMGHTDDAVKTYLDIVFQYDIERENGRLRDWFYFARAAYDAAHLLELSGTRSNLRQAARIYERLARTGLPTAEDARRKAEEIRRAHGMED